MLSKGCNISRASTDQEDEILTGIAWMHTPAGMLVASDKPISCFSIPEQNWSGPLLTLLLSVSKELSHEIVYN